jgi:hypothetical protein
MANTFDLLSTYTVPAGGIAVVEFTGISSAYRDLVIYGAKRGSSASNNSVITINNSGVANYGDQGVFGYANTNQVDGYQHTGATYWQDNTNNSASGSFFNPVRYYFPAANGSQIKTIIYESGQEWNSNAIYSFYGTGWNTGITAVISTISMDQDGSGNYVEGTTFSLYGIKNS